MCRPRNRATPLFESKMAAGAGMGTKAIACLELAGERQEDDYSEDERREGIDLRGRRRKSLRTRNNQRRGARRFATQ